MIESMIALMNIKLAYCHFPVSHHLLSAHVASVER